MSDLIHVEKCCTDFFVTGNEYIRDNLDLNFILCLNKDKSLSCSEAIHADANQNLQQSYLKAKHIFEHVAPSTIKFVLIGLSPYNFSASDKESPTACPIDEKILADYFKLCVDNSAKPVGVVLPVKQSIRKSYKVAVLKLFFDTINKIARQHRASFINLLDVKVSDELFQNRSRLNSDGVMAISALLGARLYLAKIISAGTILEMSNDFLNMLSRYFSEDYNTLMHHIFCKMCCADFNRLSKIFPKETCMDLIAQTFAGMTYDHLAILSDILLKDEYNDLAARIFKISVEKIRHKSNVKVGFFFSYSSFWFGDDLYNFFAQDERFEPILFVDIKSGNAIINEERSQDVKRFIEHGVNLFPLDDTTLSIPTLDILFCLTPYQNAIPMPFRLINLKLTTLLINFPYTFSVADVGGLLGSPFVRALWKMFFPSTILLELCKKISKVGMPRGFYSGYPKMDIFFRKDVDFKFNWKMVRPDAKKIIWAPHHSITNKGPLLATFQWNYQFMYEFAKAHPEISWVVKSHPHLPIKAVRNKIFPSIDAYKEYMQKWDDLPNAQVYMGAYYQAIFATSDGMIQDCASFVAEYQYVDKPMIYLTRDTQKFNELGVEILKASYTVDGKDLDGIAVMIQRVFIEGDDYKATERKAVFDKYLDYKKANGMLASEFIFKNITDELKN